MVVVQDGGMNLCVYNYTSECLVRKGETENKAEKCQADRDKWKKPRRDTSRALYGLYSVIQCCKQNVSYKMKVHFERRMYLDYITKQL